MYHFTIQIAMINIKGKNLYISDVRGLNKLKNIEKTIHMRLTNYMQDNISLAIKEHRRKLDYMKKNNNNNRLDASQ